MGALKGISISSVAPCIDGIGGELCVPDAFLAFVVVDVAEGFISGGLDCASICSRWYSANSFLIASTRADTASAAAEAGSPIPPAGSGRPLGNTGE